MIALYKEGDTHIVRGIACEILRCKARQLADKLNEGYVTTPEELYKKPTKDEADANNSGKLSTNEIREAAKTAGIEDYNTKRIKTLKAELGYE